METIYFKPGEVVSLKQDLPNKPVMYVIRKINNIIKSKDSDKNLKGILCRWFTTNGELQEAIFNTKDIYKV